MNSNYQRKFDMACRIKRLLDFLERLFTDFQNGHVVELIDVEKYITMYRIVCENAIRCLLYI